MFIHMCMFIIVLDVHVQLSDWMDICGRTCRPGRFETAQRRTQPSICICIDIYAENVKT